MFDPTLIPNVENQKRFICKWNMNTLKMVIWPATGIGTAHWEISVFFRVSSFLSFAFQNVNDTYEMHFLMHTAHVPSILRYIVNNIILLRRLSRSLFVDYIIKLLFFFLVIKEMNSMRRPMLVISTYPPYIYKSC